MKTKRVILVALVLLALSIPCYAIKSMMFNSIDEYIERASGIWIVEVLRQAEQEREIGPVYEAKVLQYVKGDPQKESLSFCAIFSRQITIGKRYLVLGFNKTSSGTWLDNGNVSPVEIPPALSLAELDGKSVKEQILTILTARLAEIDRNMRDLTQEKKAIEDGITFQKRSDNMPGTNK